MCVQLSIVKHITKWRDITQFIDKKSDLLNGCKAHALLERTTNGFVLSPLCSGQHIIASLVINLIFFVFLFNEHLSRFYKGLK